MLVLFNIFVYVYAIVKFIQRKCRICHARKKAKQLKLAAQGTAADSKPKAESQNRGMQDDMLSRANYIKSLFNAGSPDNAPRGNDSKMNIRDQSSL